MREIRRSTIAVLFIVVLMAVALPVLSHPMPPLIDYINHLARAYAISTIGTDADLQRFYSIEWRLIPNLMIDLVVPALHRFVNIYAAGQIFTLASLFLILSGTFALNRALFGRWSALPLAASILLYNEVLLVGVMNYIAGIGLSLWALAAWIALRERAWPWRTAVSTLFVMLLFICHLFAVGVYGLGLLAFETQRLWAKRHEPIGPRLIEFIATGVPFLPALALLAASTTWGLASGVQWQFDGKLDGLWLVITVYYYEIAYIIAAAAVAAIALATYRRVLRMHPVGWFVLGFGTVLYFAMPRVIFESHLADQRLPAAIVFILIACADLDLHRARVRQAFAAFVIVLLAIRLAEVQLAWNHLAGEFAQFRASALTIERGARVLVARGDRDAYNRETGTVSDFGLLHAASLATIERSAFVSTNFTIAGKQILHVRPQFRDSVDHNDRPPPSADWLRRSADPPDESARFSWSQWPRKFDYVYVVFARESDGNPDERNLRLTFAGSGFRLYQVIKAG